MHTLGHTIRVCKGGEGEGNKVLGMQLHVYVHRAMCMCVCVRDMQILYLCNNVIVAPAHEMPA